MTEAQARRALIDPQLLTAGWKVNDPSMVVVEYDVPTSHGPTMMLSDVAASGPYAGHSFADYVLLGSDNKPLAVVEAKRPSKDVNNGKEQALQYAQNIQRRAGGRIPFVFYTNGHQVMFWDTETYPPRKVYGYPTRADLERLDFQRVNRRLLADESIKTEIAGRPYQIEAIRAVLERVEQKHRRFLLVMATGTGKTRTAAALIDVLVRARWVERVLFLVDRLALQSQTLTEFKEHLPDAPPWPKEGEKVFHANRRVYVTTYPAMQNIIQQKGSYLSPHFFDLVIADESHRSIYNVYKEVLTYFDAIELGLTATPRDHIDHDTFNLFNCPQGLPTFAYSYQQAIEATPPYLAEFEVLNVRSKFQLAGIHEKQLTDAEKAALIADGIDPQNVNFEGTDLERKVTNSGTNALIIREFMDECIKDPTGTLPGKTIIFAISKAHANRLEALFDLLYPQHKGKLARVIVSDDKRVHGIGGLLDQFKKKSFPRIAISVDMLDTGVDIPEVVNLVFAKPVFSYTKFWQMIGRGTRLIDPKKQKTWCPTKDKFLIIDCWANFTYFDEHPKGREPNTQIPLPVALFKARLDKVEAAWAADRPEVVESVKADLRADLAELPTKSVTVLDKAKELAKCSTDEFWAHLLPKDVVFLRTMIAPVLRARSADDEKGMRFEKEVVELGSALLSKNAAVVDVLRTSIVDQVRELPLTLAVVSAEKTLIADVQGSAWWSDVTEVKLTALVDRLGPLMRYRTQGSTAMMELNLTDLTLIKDWIEFGPSHERLTTEAYRKRLEEHVLAMVKDSPVLQRLQAGEVVSDTEVLDVAETLRRQDPYVTEDILRKVYDHRTARFVQFLRHILGLEKLESWSTSVAQAFDTFIATHNTFTALQVQFLQVLKSFVLTKGTVERQDLIAAPFTQLDPNGIRGIFQPAEAAEIVAFAQKLVA